MKKYSITYLFVFLFSLLAEAQTSERLLDHESWKFRKLGEADWLRAAVPGTVHTDLYANKVVGDPYFGDNEKQLQWIEKEDWEYRTTFKISKKEMAQSHLELQFDGLDTYAKVYLNDSLILDADNMFRSWNADVKKYVHKGKNELRIVFESAVKRGSAEAKKLKYILPGDERVFTRKAQYQYGWDWGPRFVTCGIWKHVKLRSWNSAEFKSVRYVQRLLSDSMAQLEFVCQINSDISANAYLDISFGNTKDVSGQIITKIKLEKGKNTYSAFYNIRKPHLWWTSELGIPHLYNFVINLSYDSKFLDTKQLDVGLRTIELVQDKDSVGSSFYFKLNGVPVFMKGANYIPPDNFLPRVTKQDYAAIIQNALDAHMNMLRVWGGGVYAGDEFYDLCDKNGILVWQDLMFACAMYPGDDHFMDNVAAEVAEQAERLRNHPSLALWCGNNEIDEGWKNWGWQKQYKYSEDEAATIERDYKMLFENSLRFLLKANDPGRAYWPSSPSIGWGHKESLTRGDAHYWGVWWGQQPFEIYKEKTGRFMSEYGFQGMANPETYKNAVPGKGFHLDSLGFKNHQKHATGDKIIREYMQKLYNVPNDLNDYIYVSQLLQADGMKTAIEAHRRAKPYCMGTLYWQLNDCWPATSWSSVDHDNHWKAFHYQAKRSYNDVIVSVDEQKDTTCLVYIVSDLTKSLKAKLALELYDFSDHLLWSDSVSLTIDSLSSKMVYRLDKSLIRMHNLNKLVLKSSLKQLDGYASDVADYHYFTEPKDMQLQKPDVRIMLGVCEQVQCFTLQTNMLMKNVLITIDGESLNLSDNYFDLLPCDIKTIYLPKNARVKNLERRIRIRSLGDTY